MFPMPVWTPLLDMALGMAVALVLAIAVLIASESYSRQG
jgi:hypothetical protein